MAADQLPGRVREFANYLDGLLARLDASGGWCAVFWQRDPEGMRACLDGQEVPPWDVVEALLQDLAGQYGPGGAGPETEHARSLHAAALAAYDARPGGRDALGDRLDVMLREQRYAAERQADLTRLLASAPTREQADTLRLDLAWAHDDHERATARCAELRDRMTRLDAHDRGAAAFFEGRGAVAGPGGVPGAGAFGGGGGAGAAGGGAASGRPGGARGGEASGHAAGVRGGEMPGAAAGVSGGQTPGAPGAVSGGGAPTDAPRGGSGPSGPGDVFGGARPAAGAPGFGAGAVGDGSRASSGGVRAFGDGPSRPADVFGGARPAAGASAFGAGAAEGVGDTADGASPREQRAPGGPYDPATPWHPAHQQTASGTAGRHDTRHADAGPDPERERDAQEHPAGRAVPAPVAAPEPQATPQPTPKQRKRRRGSARFAGMDEEEAMPVVVPPAAVPTLPESVPVTGRTRRGARFAGVAEEATVQDVGPRGEAGGAADRAEVTRTVGALARLRAEGRSGEAHVLLVELTSSPPARFPLLAGELERAGLGADWQTLLWEAASLPAGALVAAADALGAAGRVADGQQILRQGVARPPAEVGAAVLGLAAEGRHREVRALLDAYVRARTPEEAARSAEPDPRRLVPLLLAAAQGVSDERRWDLVHALRVAGFPA
ncbi:MULTISPECIES: hypothetical protein [Streptomyces]|uniref:UL36 very large tegument protein n=1 Tax=Streptomyces koelreuteriae TaxID=2838015 RepID=A0ABX8FLT2_9ACTN|nr:MULTISPECIES: hypothetical protein [Streptomyces]QWB22118.1 hypothetical protein KJK29_05750 [Streptomyces koelreuteriae]UUA05055.1 hypothetical protein NNW98_05785 [Streptomyces koelreuteriae]UUA12679.1 hypothetical protein NNW99_05785 [Streptomyces sp. CRCS-T-1]